MPKRDDDRFLESLVSGPASLGELLQTIRENEEETQAECARRLGISRGNLCDIEKGRTLVSVARAQRFAEALGYPPQQWVELALQDELAAARLNYRVSLHA